MLGVDCEAETPAIKGSMDNLKIEQLEITVARGNPVVVEWIGAVDFLDPSPIINPFFDELAGTIDAGQVIVDFTKVTYMNSSAIAPVIYLCKLFDKKDIQILMKYDWTCDWQVATFKGMETLSQLMKNLTVEPVVPSP